MQTLTKAEQYGAMSIGAFLNWYKSHEDGDLVTAEVHRQEALHFCKLKEDIVMSESQQYMGMAIESTLNASAATERGDRASERLDHSAAQKHYEDARMHEMEAVRFEGLSRGAAQ